ncbi:MAG: serine/threonine-protein kinase [Candidatus Delongbacteria bacterium]|nr:serine/threonine-protein kinase [Candidatus Delongbacteria bacterium]
MFFPQDPETILSDSNFSYVFLGARAKDGERVIIKVLNPELREIKHARVHFLLQASIQINHPGIIQNLDLAKDEHSYYIVQEFVHSADIKTLIRLKQANDERLISRIMIPVLDALEKTHNQNIVHRNLKPSNILVAFKPETETINWKNPDIRIIDFDKAKTPDDMPLYRGDEKKQPISLVYSAPEIVLNHETLTDQRSDIYSLGVIILEMFTGIPVFYDDNPAKIISNQMIKIPSRPKKMYPKFYDIIAKAMAKNKIEGPPSKIPHQVISEKLREGMNLRYNTAAEMKSDIIDFLQDPGSPPKKGLGVFSKNSY